MAIKENARRKTGAGLCTFTVRKHSKQIQVSEAVTNFIARLSLYKHNGNTIHLFNDRPTTQYHEKLNTFIFANIQAQKAIRATMWNFLDAGHDKVVLDGVSATVKKEQLTEGHWLIMTYKCKELD